MDRELLRELGTADEAALGAIDYIRECIALYEEVLNAMGELDEETVTRTVDNTQIVYVNPPKTESRYAHLPEYH